MNSQQELLEAINTISQNRDKSFDTPATVLRVEGDTVWVHIDGGADETPVNKTISCAEGETVQVRISNGSAFLVGNASAPPTDDKTANVAHFVAEQADEKATEAIKSVNAIVQTVEGKVDSGDSNITDISSTMYQDAYGVNIFNDTLAVGDSYAHIDGDSFDIKEVTTAGTIDNTNDKVVATFGADEVAIGYIDETDGGYQVSLSPTGIELVEEQTTPYRRMGWNITNDKIEWKGSGSSMYRKAEFSLAHLYFRESSGSPYTIETEIQEGEATFNYRETISAIDYWTRAKIQGGTIDLKQLNPWALPANPETLLKPGVIQLTGNVQDMNGNNLTPTILTSSTISASTTSYTFTDDAITADSTIDIYDTIFGFAPSNIQTSAGSCTVTFPAQSSSHQIKLFVY